MFIQPHNEFAVFLNSGLGFMTCFLVPVVKRSECGLLGSQVFPRACLGEGKRE